MDNSKHRHFLPVVDLRHVFVTRSRAFFKHGISCDQRQPDIDDERILSHYVFVNERTPHAVSAAAICDKRKRHAFSRRKRNGVKHDDGKH